jgi:oligopeptide/dipeptide ABC transporter ATP-binding protein
MYLGEIVELADAAPMFDEQLHPYSKALLASVLFPDPDARHSGVTLEGEIPSPIELPSGCFLHPRCPYRTPHTEEAHPELAPFEGRQVRCWRVAEIRADASAAQTVHPVAVETGGLS